MKQKLCYLAFAFFFFTGGISHAVTYAEWSSTDIYQLSVVSSSSNLLVTQLYNGTWGTVRSDISVSSGKWYWEYEMIYHGTTGATEYAIMGVANATADITIPLGTDNYGFGYFASTGETYKNSSLTACGATITGYNHDIVGVALDMDNGLLEYYKNGVYQCSMVSLPSGPLFASVAVGSQYEGLRANFGATAFDYTPPSGYNAGLYSGTGGGGDDDESWSGPGLSLGTDDYSQLPGFPTWQNDLYDSCGFTELTCYATTTFNALFGIDEDYVASSTGYLSYTLLHKFPIGYITDIVTIFATTSSSSLTVLDVEMPDSLPFGGGKRIRLDLANSLNFVLYATSTIFNNDSASSTDTFYQITSRYWRIFLALSVILYLVFRVFPRLQLRHDKTL